MPKRPLIVQETYNWIRYNLFKICPHQVLKFEFKRNAGYKLNLNHPQTFNEKLQWMKLNWYDPKATICADKYEVRKYIKECGLGHLLIDLYGVYEDIDEIIFDNLPEEFVMKVTHGCGQNLICKNKTELGWEKEKKNFRKWLKTSHYYDSLEWVYKDIKPRIIIERLIKTADNKPPKDYKVFCFDGKPQCLFVASDRGKGTTKFDFYDCEWNPLNVVNHYPNSIDGVIKPKLLDEMLKYASIISSGFPHMRVDFYIEDDKIIFGECTFFHFSGSQPFKPIEFDYQLGTYLNLPS